jgi:hypothetical protein
MLEWNCFCNTAITSIPEKTGNLQNNLYAWRMRHLAGTAGMKRRQFTLQGR